eukprot:scaffold4589_cov106-Isochrysis_galbana.AAC.7
MAASIARPLTPRAGVAPPLVRKDHPPLLMILLWQPPTGHRVLAQTSASPASGGRRDTSARRRRPAQAPCSTCPPPRPPAPTGMARWCYGAEPTGGAPRQPWCPSPLHRRRERAQRRDGCAETRRYLAIPCPSAPARLRPPAAVRAQPIGRPRHTRPRGSSRRSPAVRPTPAATRRKERAPPGPE